MAIIGTLLLATLLASFTDWLFFDALVHKLYRAEPAIWRPSGTRRIIVSQLVSTAATAAAIILAVLLPGRPLLLALGLFAAGALPIEIHTLQWMRVHPVIAASHAAGWLLRLLIATFAAAALL